MASGYSEWQSPREADPCASPSRRRVQELKKKFETANKSSESHSKGKGHGSSGHSQKYEKGHSHGSGKGRERGHGSGSSHGSGPSQRAEPCEGAGPSQGSGSSNGHSTSQEFSDSLEFHETKPSFEDVLESTRIDGQPKKSRPPENVQPSVMEPEGFPKGFQYPNYARQPPKKPKEEKEESMAQSEDDSFYRNWYIENMGKVTDYEILSVAVLYLLCDAFPDLRMTEYYPGNELAEKLNEYVSDLQSKFRKFDLDLREVQESQITGMIHGHKKKVLDVISELEKQLDDAREEISRQRSNVAELEMELMKAHDIIEQFRIQQDEAAAKKFDPEELMRQLEKKMRKSLSESQNEELEYLRKENDKLCKKLLKFSRQKVENEEQCMRDLSEASEEFELNSMLKEALFEMLEGSCDEEPNDDDAQKIINRWIYNLTSAINDNNSAIEQKHDAYITSKNDLADLESKHQENLGKIEQIKSKIEKTNEKVEHHKQQKQQLQNEINELTNEVAQMEERKNQLQSQVDSASLRAGSPHSSERSGGPHRSKGSGGMDEAEASHRTHSPKGSKSPGTSDKQHSFSRGKSRSSSPHERYSPGNQTPTRGQTRHTKRLIRTDSPDKRDCEERTPKYKHYFPSQGPNYGSDFSFQYPSPGYFGFQDTPEKYSEEEEEPSKPPDEEAVIRPHIWFGPGTQPFTPPNPNESIVDDVFYSGVGSPYDFRPQIEWMRWKKGMIYKDILPSFDSYDNPFIHPYRFRDLPSDRYFLSPEAEGGAQSSGGRQSTGTSDSQHSSGNRSGSPHEMPSPGRHTPKSGQKRHDHRRLIRSDRPDNRDSFDITPPYRHYFPSQGPGYGSDFSFQYPSPEYFENQEGGQGKCSHGHSQTLTKTITISPDQEEPFQVNIEMKPQGISESASGEHVICDIAVNVQDALKQALELQQGFQRKKKTRKPPKQYMRGTPPITPSRQRDPDMGTPKSIFKQRHYGAKNLFGAQKDPYKYKRRANKTIEWEQKTPEFEDSLDNTLLDNQSSPEDPSPNTWIRPKGFVVPQSQWKPGGFDAPESQWNRPDEFGGASPPKEHSQSFPGAEQHQSAPDPSTA